MSYTKLLILFLSITLFLFPQSVQAVSVTPGPAPHFVSEESIEINRQVNGDTFLVGENVAITSPVDGDLFIIANKVLISAPVNGDVRVISSDIQIQSMINGSFAFIAEKVLVTSIGEISSDAYGISSKFNLYGRIGGDLNLGYADQADILIDGNIVGNVHYLNTSPNITGQAFLGGELVETDISQFETSEKDVRLYVILQKVIHSLSLIFIAFLFTRFFGSQFTKGFESYKRSFAKNILFGFLGFLVFPLIIIALFISIIGVPLALISLAVFAFLIYIAPIYLGTFIGTKLLPNSKNILIQTICGIFIFDAISMGPFIGGLLYAVAILTFVGHIFRSMSYLKNRKRLKQ